MGQWVWYGTNEEICISWRFIMAFSGYVEWNEPTSHCSRVRLVSLSLAFTFCTLRMEIGRTETVRHSVWALAASLFEVEWYHKDRYRPLSRLNSAFPFGQLAVRFKLPVSMT